MNTNYFSIEQDLKDKNLDITRKHSSLFKYIFFLYKVRGFRINLSLYALFDKLFTIL